MRIGELAAKTGVEVETIRYYEREGLLPAPERNAAGYRQYRQEHLEELVFIRHCRSLDMALAEIRVLQDFRHHPQRACGEVNALLERHVVLVHERIAQMQQLERQLTALLDRCGELRTAAECGILRSLNAAAEGASAASPLAASPLRAISNLARSASSISPAVSLCCCR